MYSLALRLVGSLAVVFCVGGVTHAAPDCRNTGFYQKLIQPPSIAADKLIDTKLRAETVYKCVNGRRVKLKSYVDERAGVSSLAVGPAYILNVDEKKTGPTLRVNFTNKLGPANRRYDCGHEGDDVELCTNLHTHGFHVSPKGSDDPSKLQSDYVLLTISPATQPVQYQFDIPNTHAPGTHWLHAHLHGSTAPQVQNGMAGTLILKGKLDKTLEDKYRIVGDKDKIMMLQQMSLDGGTTPLCGKAPNGDNVTTSINGLCLPTIVVKENDVERWRFIHAGITATVNLAIEDANGNKRGMHEFARDGITMNGYQTRTNIILQPGYRSDILFRAPRCRRAPCEFFLVDDASSGSDALYGETEPRNQIAKIIVEAGSGESALLPPETIFTNPYKFVCDPTDFKRCAEGLEKKKVWFAVVPQVQGRPEFRVNGGIFPETPTHHLTLNGQNTWKLWVGENQTSAANHPFHIHVNPFQVIDQNGFSYWKDTLLVSGSENKGEENALTVVSRYENFTGKFVLHCHNLVHEDRGMMMKVVVTK